MDTRDSVSPFRLKGKLAVASFCNIPIPTNKSGSPLPLPQRPMFTAKSVEKDVLLAMKEGWEPLARGKALVFYIS
jgi:hypothetical protein